MTAWWTFIRERFPPAAYGPLILLFTLANGLPGDGVRLFAVLLITASFFLRLRIFDELKDYEVDLRVNPSRPLARGLITLRDAKRALFFLLTFEAAAAYGLGAFSPWLLAAAYSLLMYNEFFLGDFLRPRLTLYAITHTFVCALVANFVASTLGGRELAFLLMNWFFFNLFEFARKTFAADEERPEVDSYSKIFGLPVAILLSASQAATGVGLLWWSGFPIAAPAVALAGYLAVCATAGHSLKRFRALTGAYLMIHYLAVVMTLLRM